MEDNCRIKIPVVVDASDNDIFELGFGIERRLSSLMPGLLRSAV